MARIRWIPEARSVRKVAKMFSVQAMVVSQAVLGTWVAMPAKLQAEIDPQTVVIVAMAALVFGIVGRLVDQGIKRENPSGNH